MALAFQVSAFQESPAFQTQEVEVVVPVAPPAVPQGVGSGISGRLWVPKGKFKPPRFNQAKMPDISGRFSKSLPTSLSRSLPKPEFTPIEKPPEESQLTEERWRAWQASPAAAGKGSASILEFLVFEFLVKKKHLKEDIDFIYQAPIAGGRTRFGGFVADFYFPVRREVWNPAGLQFHWTKTKQRANDILSRQVLANRGIKLIFLWEDDLMNRSSYTLEKAWNGIELPRR